MATLGELCRQHTSLNRDEINHLKQLVSEWGLLADLCFADLLLYVPSTDAGGSMVAQVRPATGQTIYLTDYVGVRRRQRAAAARRRRSRPARSPRARSPSTQLAEPARMLAIPVRCDGKPIAVLTREWSSRSGRQSGELERTYLGIFQRFAAMIAEGTFPFRGPVGDSSAAPRVGDGVMVLDDEARVRYASPERRVGAAPRRHQRQRGRHAPRRAGLQRQPGAPGLRGHDAGHRGVRADAQTSRC